MGDRKYASGSTPPTSWLMTVATAAPSSPHPNPTMNSASSPMLVTPAATVTIRPSRGRSAVIKKLWNTFCSMNAAVNEMTIRP